MSQPKSPSRGDVLTLDVERAVAGGDMLARYEGRVIFVAGAIPGERVRARIERTTKSAAWARVVEIETPSADRRDACRDVDCGGLSFAHIAYPAQLRLKAGIIADAFSRIGRIVLPAPVDVMPSPEDGYRLRARLHVRHGRAGFFRAQTHALCDPAPGGQLHGDTLRAVAACLTALGPRVDDVDAVVVAENVAATERVLHLEAREGETLESLVRKLPLPERATGVTTDVRGRVLTLAGQATVTDVAPDLFGGASPVGGLVAWTRHAPAFFQGNRFLVGALARAVLDAVEGGRVADLYAGVGLFSVALAARGAHVIAVEGDRLASADLASNAGSWKHHLQVVRSDVESSFAALAEASLDTVIVDPPRTGLSPEALAGLLRLQPRTLVYVSCDPPTLARDLAKCVADGYEIRSVRAFDLFPNTPHVETLVVLEST